MVSIVVVWQVLVWLSTACMSAHGGNKHTVAPPHTWTEDTWARGKVSQTLGPMLLELGGVSHSLEFGEELRVRPKTVCSPELLEF